MHTALKHKQATLTSLQSVGSAAGQPQMTDGSRHHHNRHSTAWLGDKAFMLFGSLPPDDMRGSQCNCNTFLTHPAAGFVCAALMSSQEGAGANHMPVWKGLLCDCMVSGAYNQGPQHEILQLLLCQEEQLQQQAAVAQG
jgi:hypothetical protein